VDNYSDERRSDGQWTFDYDCLTTQVTRMAGTDIDAAQKNLVGDVTFQMGSKCGAFDYGNGATGAGVPVQPPAQPPAQQSKPKPVGGTPQPIMGAAPASACVRTARAGSARTASRRHALRFSDTTRVDVFRASSATRVFGLRRVARLTGRDGRVTWRPVRLASGIYVARLRTSQGARRFVYEVRGGRLYKRRDYESVGCGALRSARLRYPAFGGRPSRALELVVRGVKGARTVAELRRGGKLVRRKRGGSTLRMTVPARGRRKGVYTVRVRATKDGKTERATLTARRL
jgi:hypothetical protein